MANVSDRSNNPKRKVTKEKDYSWVNRMAQDDSGITDYDMQNLDRLTKRKPKK